MQTRADRKIVSQLRDLLKVIPEPDPEPEPEPLKWRRCVLFDGSIWYKSYKHIESFQEWVTRVAGSITITRNRRSFLEDVWYIYGEFESCINKDNYNETIDLLYDVLSSTVGQSMLKNSKNLRYSIKEVLDDQLITPSKGII